MSAEAALTPAAAREIAPHLFPDRLSPTPAQIAAAIEKTLEVQRRAVTFGKRPFAAVLLGPDNETVLLTHQSIDQVNHAESSLARLAYSHYSKEFLWRCTLVSTWEPCAMCSSTIYWAHIGRVIYAASNEQLAQLTGPGNKENFTMKWHTRDILEGQQKDIEIIGPVEGMDQVVMRESDVYWSTTRQ
ncbi:cytidine deaminase-like protein [Bisporella sp. PMI_857]|nr:cytidine deaminase-like protein [Bisporella sp. PMI_857]